MNQEYYNRLYAKAKKAIGDHTPLKADCGQLCGGACCKGDEETGMLLFPGEDTVFPVKEKNGNRLCVCEGACDRRTRPLSCILFPFLSKTLYDTLGTVVITIALLFLDKNSIKEVNYPLLATFCVFFVFSGNLARIPAVNDFFSWLLPKNTLLFGILSCQVISNVPSAVLLSHFTNDYAALLPAVNIGGLGTIIASLASLITISEYRLHNPTGLKKYMVQFTTINVGFLIVLYIIQSLLL